MEQSFERRPEVDLLRTIAILGMVVYHIAFDLQEFYGFDINVFSGPWKTLARATAILFLLLVGVSFYLSAERKHNNIRLIFQGALKRAAILFFFAYVITLVTYFWAPDEYIRFGILHLIATSLLFLPFFVHFGVWNALIGLFCLALGPVFSSMQTIHSNLLIFGITPPGFQSLDYFPLFPWFGVVLLGFALGKLLYGKEQNLRIVSLPLALTMPGRISLAIYMLHQPVILGILWLLPI